MRKLVRGARAGVGAGVGVARRSRRHGSKRGGSLAVSSVRLISQPLDRQLGPVESGQGALAPRWACP